MPDVTFTSFKWALLLPGIFIVIDCILGFVKAFFEKKLKSDIMTKGLFKKLGEISILAIAIAVSEAMGLPDAIIYAASFYICCTELVSIASTLEAAGVPFPKWLSGRFDGEDSK